VPRDGRPADQDGPQDLHRSHEAEDSLQQLQSAVHAGQQQSGEIGGQLALSIAIEHTVPELLLRLAVLLAAVRGLEQFQLQFALGLHHLDEFQQAQALLPEGPRWRLHLQEQQWRGHAGFFGALLFLAICRVQLNQEIAATTSFARLFWFLRFCFLLFAFGVLSAFAFAFCVLLFDFVLLLLVAKRPTYLFIYFFSSAAKKKE